MISAKRLFKSGREKKVLEVKDDLQINNFFNDDGFPYTTLHGKKSRISFIIVDVTKGKKEKSILCKFCFTKKEVKELCSAIDSNTNFKSYCKKKYNVDYFTKSKAIPYNSFGNGYIEVRRFKLSYEENMKKSKWKIEIHKGMARPDEDNFGFKKDTYKVVNKCNYFLNDVEIIDMKEAITEYIPLWEQYAFPIFMKYREDFMERSKQNNYCEDNIDVWNVKVKSNADTSENFDENNYVDKNNTYTIKNEHSAYVGSNLVHCSKCNVEVENNLANYTKAKFGKVYCSKCFNKHKNII